MFVLWNALFSMYEWVVLLAKQQSSNSYNTLEQYHDMNQMLNISSKPTYFPNTPFIKAWQSINLGGLLGKQMWSQISNPVPPENLIVIPHLNPVDLIPPLRHNHQCSTICIDRMNLYASAKNSNRENKGNFSQIWKKSWKWNDILMSK